MKKVKIEKIKLGNLHGEWILNYFIGALIKFLFHFIIVNVICVTPTDHVMVRSDAVA